MRVQVQDFDLAAEIAQLRASDSKIGAVVTFLGTVRDINDGSAVAEMELEHYPGMTEKALEDIVLQAKTRWHIADALVVHRVGPLEAVRSNCAGGGDLAPHRGEAFAACEFIIDYLKTQAPFWKKEQTPQGARWVDARVTDDLAMQKWDYKKNMENP